MRHHQRVYKGSVYKPSCISQNQRRFRCWLRMDPSEAASCKDRWCAKVNLLLAKDTILTRCLSNTFAGITQLFFSLRAAVFKIDASHLEMTTYPRHRDSFGSRWQSGRPIYTIPDETASAAHKSSSVKGLCGLRSNHSAYVLWGSERGVSCTVHGN